MSAELILSHIDRGADILSVSNCIDYKLPYFGKGVTKFPQGLHHVFEEVAHSRPTSCSIRELGSYVIGLTTCLSLLRNKQNLSLTLCLVLKMLSPNRDSKVITISFKGLGR